MKTLSILIPLLPLLSAVMCQLSAKTLGNKFYRISIACNALAFLVAAYHLLMFLLHRQSLLVGADSGIGSLYLDALSMLMAVMVIGISLIVHIYSIRYMCSEQGYLRFFVLLDMITAVILVMVMAGDLLTLLVAWHLTSVLLYFLLNHNFTSDRVNRYAFWTLITHRLGDLPLLIAVVLLYQGYDTLSLPVLFQSIAADPAVTTLFGLPLLETVGYLIAISAFAKSAQFPLHTWLPYTMEGPTPVSALMHAGIVNTGGFLINRFAPIFVHTSDVLHLIFAVGCITAVLGSALMLMQNDIKKSLGYSTMGQMGYMIMECGVGAFSLAIFHLFAHGVFKGTLFLGSGGVIGAARKNDGMPEDEVYKFVVEHRAPPSRLPWLIFAMITLIVPLFILGVAHWFVTADFLRYQGAIVLLFFGWITGAQTLFAIYKLGGQNSWKILVFTIISFTVVVIGYVLIGHNFDTFLYPDAAFREQLYTAANIDIATFYVIIGLITALVVAGWLLVYYPTVNKIFLGQRFKNLYLDAYSLFSREFYIADLYTRLTDIVLALSRRLNTLMKWV